MTDTTASTTDLQEITSFLDTWVAALRAKDVEAYAACYTDDARVFDGMNPPQHAGIDAWRGMIATWFTEIGTESDLLFRDRQITIDADLAVMTAFAGYKHRPEGEPEAITMWCRQTNILRRIPDGWRICHEHSSVPFDPESGQADFGMQP